jgi:hypothetical protein
MTDDNIIRLHSRPHLAMCTGEDTGPVKRLDNIRLPADLVDADALEKLGFGRGIPFSEGSTRVGYRTLRELRDRAQSAAVAAADAEHGILSAVSCMERAVSMSYMARVEMDTIARHLTELLGDDDSQEPDGAA